jgi:hypothetical protein
VAALASGAQACGGDDTGGTTVPDSGPPDSTVADGGSDASKPDASDGGKTGSDATTNDAGDGGAPDADAAALCTAFDAGSLDEASVGLGMTFVRDTGRCFRCHQSDPDAAITLSGNNVSISDGGMVFPPNLTPDLMSGLGCLSNDQIANAILFGKDPMGDGGLLCVMPKYGVVRTAPDGATAPPLLDASSVTSVVEYLRSLAAVHNQVPETVCPMTPPPGDSGSEGGSLDAGEAGVSDASDAASSDAATEASDAAADASDAAADAAPDGSDAAQE